jgi:hypothetical protein
MSAASSNFSIEPSSSLLIHQSQLPQQSSTISPALHKDPIIAQVLKKAKPVLKPIEDFPILFPQTN